MGTAVSRTKLPPEALEHMPTFRKIGLQEKHLRKLYKTFAHIDKDHSGELDLYEVLDYLKVAKTPFTQRVFRIFDEDGSGQIDFREFVLSTWNYATLTKSSLVLFAFDLYDEDGSGSIETEEIINMCKDVYGEEYNKSRLAMQILEKIHKLSDPSRGSGVISIDKFATFCDHHPGLLYPAFQFQNALQKAILGHAYWHKLSKERLVMANGVQVSIKEILTAHIDERKFKELATYDNPDSEAILPEKMQREARKTLMQRRDTTDFREIINVTGTVAQRRSTASAQLQSATTKLSAARALQNSRREIRPSMQQAPGRHGARMSRTPSSRNQNVLRSHSSRDALRTGANGPSAMPRASVAAKLPRRSETGLKSRQVQPNLSTAKRPPPIIT